MGKGRRRMAVHKLLVARQSRKWVQTSGTRFGKTITKKVSHSGIPSTKLRAAILISFPVERRRRETINEGINELAKIVPGCEKNKGSILARAVQFITQLKENETQNIEKWTLEKLLSEQAITELGTSCDKLKAECQRAWAECEQWKKAALKAGVTIDHDEKGGGDAE